MAIYYSVPEKRILGIDTEGNKSQRVRTINRGEFLRLVSYPCDTSSGVFTEADNIIILGGLSIGTIPYKMGYIPLERNTGTLDLAWCIYGKEQDSYDEIKELFNFSKDVEASTYTEIVKPSFSYKTFYEICKDDNNANFIKHKNDIFWYLGIKVKTVGSNPPTGMIFDMTYCEGTPSEMALSDIGV